MMKPTNKRLNTEFLPVALCLLPVLALNIGISFISGISLKWQKEEYQKNARAEAEALFAASSFDRQVSNRAGRFAKKLFDSFELYADGTITKQVFKNQTEFSFKNEFSAPFPKTKAIAFELSQDLKTGKTLFQHTSDAIGNSAYRLAFSFLVKKAENVKTPKSSSILKSLFGEALQDGVLLSDEFRSRVAYVTHLSSTHCLLWDFKKYKNKKYYGFFVLVEAKSGIETHGRLLALDELSKSRQKNTYGAFIPLFKNVGGAVIQGKLNKSRLFQSWLKKEKRFFLNAKKPQSTNDPNDPTDVESVEKIISESNFKAERVGGAEAYSYIGKGASHKAVLFKKPFKAQSSFQWLKAFNVCFGFIFVLLLTRGILFGEWPKLSLRMRFLTIYLFSATLPVAMLIVAASGYLLQYRKAKEFAVINNLRLAVLHFDTQKDTLQGEYKAAFTEVLKNDNFLDALENKNYLKAKETVVESFMSKGLPLLGLKIIDTNNSRDKRGRDYPEMVYHGGASTAKSEPTINTLSRPIAQMLKAESENKPVDDIDFAKANETEKISELAYNSMSNQTIIEDLEANRARIISHRSSTAYISHIHDRIVLKNDTKPKYALLVIWDNQRLDAELYNSTLNSLKLKSPEIDLAAFKKSLTGLEPFSKIPDRHSKSLLNISKNTAEQAFFRNGLAVSKPQKDYTIAAITSKKYADTVFVAGFDHHAINKDIFERILFIALLIIASVLVVIYCTAYSTNQILLPIILLKQGIDRVASGQLGTQISSSRTDEIGSLCSEFLLMTDGLKERQRLSTLISGHAVSAITTSEAASELKEKTFNGTALVSDIRNFTVMCEKQKPNEVTSLLNKHYAEMSFIISLYGGQIYKFIGDAVEAVFEESSKFDEPSAARAFNAACMMLLRVKQINEAREQKSLFTYKSGVGLSAGPMHSGLVGSLKSRVDYAILGKPLEEAAGLESASKLHEGLPLIVDKNVCKMLKNTEIKLKRLEKADKECYFLENLNYIKKAEIEFNKKKQNAKNEAKKQNNTQTETFQISKTTIKASLFNFAISAAFVLFIACGIALTHYIAVTARCEREKSAYSEANHMLATRLLADDAPMYAFETKCKKLLRDLELKIARNKGVADESLKEFFDSNSGSLQNGFKTATSITYQNKGAGFCYSNTVRGLLEDFNNRLISETTFGRAIVFYAADTKNGYKQKYYFFYDQVAKVSEKNASDIFNAPTKNNFNSDICGYILLSAPCSEIDSNLKYQINAFADKNISIAVIKQDGKKTASQNFPKQVLEAINFESDDAANKEIDGYLITTNTKTGINPLQISIAQKLKYTAEKSPFDSRTKAVYAGITMLFILLCLIINFKNTIIDSFVSARIYLAMLAVSVIPFVFMSLIFGRFLDEDYIAQMNAEKSNLSEFLSNFESKKNVSDPLMWNIAARYLEKEGLKVIASASARAEKELEGSSQSGKPALSRVNLRYLENSMGAWLNKAAQYTKNDIYNFQVKQIVVIDKNFEYSASAIDKGKSSAFLENIKSFIRSLAVTKYPESFIPLVQESKVSFEEVAMGEAVLGIIKAIYGSETFLRAVSAIEAPLTVFSARGGFSYRLAFLSEEKSPFANGMTTAKEAPKWAVYFFVLHDYSNFLARLAQRCSTEKMPVFVGGWRKHLFPADLKHRLELEKIAALSVYSFLPSSLQIKEKDQTITACTAFSGSESETVIVGAVSDKDIRQKQLLLIKYFAGFLIALLAFLVVLARVIANDITEPLACLKAGFERVSDGDFDYRINLNRPDELGELCASFDVMMRGLAEKETMGKMLSKSAKSFAANQNAQSAVRDYVFMYVGIPAFNSFAEYSAVEEIFADLQKHITAVSGIIINRHGDVDKIIEHKILAVFNVGNSAQKAIQAACEAAKEIIKCEAEGALPYPVSIGINCGKVIAGFLGVGTKRDYTVIGDAVNVAARIEGFAQKLRYQRCLISDDVFELLPKKSMARPFEEVQLKGKSRPMQLYRLNAD